MRRQPLLLLGLAVVAGGLAALLALQVLRTPPPTVEETDEPGTVSVVVAARDLDVGTLVTEEDVTLVDWPSDAVPSGYATSPEEVVDRGLLTTVAENAPLLSRQMASPEAGAGMQTTIPEGKRAMSVSVDDVVGVAGFVLPGTRVDVVVTMDSNTPTGEPTTQAVLQNLKVLSAGQNIASRPEGEAEQVPVVTLAVDPEEAEKLAMAHSNGRIQLALRNPLDLELEETAGIQASHLIGGPPAPVAAPAPAPEPEPPRELEIYRGDQRSTSTVDSEIGGDDEDDGGDL